MYAHEDIEALFGQLMDLSRPLLKPDEDKLIAQAFALAKQHAPHESEVAQLLHICLIAVGEINLSGKAIVSILLHRYYEHALPVVSGAHSDFSPKIGTIIGGLRKVQSTDTSNTRLVSENILKLIMAQADDVRVILISLAIKLHALRTIEMLPRQQQELLCRELRVLYAPLAHRLGLYAIKTEMEEMAMKYLDNEIYKTISQKLKENKQKRERYIQQFIEPLQKALTEQGIVFEIKGRPKSIHSIWNKLKNNHSQFEQIYDLFAIRIIIDCPIENEKQQCWHAYSVVSDIYRPNPLRLRDWISAPKKSGYESLHITVVGPDSKWVEVQIRTRRMDEIAEKGHAAHWIYKEGPKAAGHTGWLGRIREALESEDSEAIDEDNTARIDLYSDELFIFTPTGDLVKLRTGATLLDFAFALHTNVGFTCTGGKINGKVATINKELHNGDRAEIFTSKNQTPKQDWLNFARTSKARSKIKKYLRESQFAEAEMGKELLVRKLNQLKVKFADESVYRMVKHFRAKDSLDLYMMAAHDKIEASELRQLFSEPEKSAQEKRPQQIDSTSFEDKINSKITNSSDNYLVIDNNIDKIEYTLAKCCAPIRGDEIFGFVTMKDGIKIHRTSCPNAPQLQNKYPYRIVKTAWTDSKGNAFFNVGVRITGTDEISILSSITQIIANDSKVNIRNLAVDSNDGTFEAKISMYITDNQHLDKLLSKFKALKGVHSAVRINA
jgi:GTP diphosphokinase / guanosine-3',5'-bis(diphosphate) 3'-diphosphatase